MDSLKYNFVLDAFNKSLSEEIEGLEDVLLGGGCSDMVHYSGLVGKRNGLRIAVEVLKDALSKLEQMEEDDE